MSCRVTIVALRCSQHGGQNGGHFQGLNAPYSEHFCCAAGDVFDHPTPAPSPLPSVTPVPSVSPLPTPAPSSLPTSTPTDMPSAVPSAAPTALPSVPPTSAPSPSPTQGLCHSAPTYSATMCASLFGGTCYSSEVRCISCVPSDVFCVDRHFVFVTSLVCISCLRLS